MPARPEMPARPAMPVRPVMPVRPTRAPDEAPPRGSLVGLVLGLGFGLFMAGLLSTALILTLGSLGIAIVLVVTTMIGFGALHYLLWGWWLGDMIRRDVAEEEAAAEEAAADDRKPTDPSD